jgi:ribosomal protein L11 methylase PrmA
MNARNLQISGWQPTPYRIVREALRLAETRPVDLLFDLGCGDGRVVTWAARFFGTAAVGFDLDPWLLSVARDRIMRLGLGHLARVRRQSMLSIPDLERATIIFLFLPQTAVNRLKPILANRCHPGTRIVSVSTAFLNWEPDKELVVRGVQARWWIGLWYL